MRKIKDYILGPKTENGGVYWVQISKLVTFVIPPGQKHILSPKGNVLINTVICNMKCYVKSINLMLQNYILFIWQNTFIKLLQQSYYLYCPAGLWSYSNTVIKRVIMLTYVRKFDLHPTSFIAYRH